MPLFRMKSRSQLAGSRSQAEKDHARVALLRTFTGERVVEQGPGFSPLVAAAVVGPASTSFRRAQDVQVRLMLNGAVRGLFWVAMVPRGSHKPQFPGAKGHAIALATLPRCIFRG